MSAVGSTEAVASVDTVRVGNHLVKSRRGRRGGTNELPMFDQEMRALKGKDTVVKVYLPGPTAFTDEEDNSFDAHVQIVDRFAIKFSVIGTRISVWVPKQDVLIQVPA